MEEVQRRRRRACDSKMGREEGNHVGLDILLGCIKRKMKCDSKMPCRNCAVKKLQSRCTYSYKKKPGPKCRTGADCSLGIKRARMSPSMATGLIGMQESYFINLIFMGLTDFFPVVNEMDIRECMVAFLGHLEMQRSFCGTHGGETKASY